jgi:hypothetical protein
MSEAPDGAFVGSAHKKAWCWLKLRFFISWFSNVSEASVCVGHKQGSDLDADQFEIRTRMQSSVLLR